MDFQGTQIIPFATSKPMCDDVKKFVSRSGCVCARMWVSGVDQWAPHPDEQPE